MRAPSCKNDFPWELLERNAVFVCVMEITMQPVLSPERAHFIPSDRPRVGRVLLASVVLHFALIAILALQERKPAPAPPAYKPAIVATLYQAQPQKAALENVPPLPVPDMKGDDTHNQPAGSEQDSLPIASDSPLSNQTKDNNAPILQVPDAPSLNKAPASSPLTAPVAVDVPSAPVSTSTAPRLSSRQALNGYFSRLEAEKRQAQAEQAARDRRERHRSPVITDTRKDEPEEDTSAPPPVNVDCSSSATKTLSVISRFTGGRVTCSDRGNGFDTFIDARLNKGVKPQENPDNRR